MNNIKAQIVDQGDYLLVTCDSTATISDKSLTLDTLAEYINTKSCNKVLFDIRESLSCMSEDDHMACGELLMERKSQFSGCKFAFLTPRREPVLFLSLAYTNGFTSFLEVESKSDASLWFSGHLH